MPTNLVYGENPHQEATYHWMPDCPDPLVIQRFGLNVPPESLHHNTITALDTLLTTARQARRGLMANSPLNNNPVIVLVNKHSTFCGGAIDKNPKAALEKAIDGDLKSIFGGSVLLTSQVTKKLAETLLHYQQTAGKIRFLEFVAAPQFDEVASLTLKEKGVRLFINPALASAECLVRVHDKQTRQVIGGELVQDGPNAILKIPDEWNLPREVKEDLVLAYAIGSTVPSNTIALVHNGQLIGLGAGQTKRKRSAELALDCARKSNHRLADAVAYSDGFFSHPDAVMMLCLAGIAHIIAPHGSKKDDEIAKVCKEHEVSLWRIPHRGFYGH